MTTEPDMRRDAVWQGEALAATYLGGVRGAIPLAAEQIAILVRLARAARPAARAILDLGCGDGILGHALFDAYGARPTVVLADFSPAMLAAARARVAQAVSLSQQGHGGTQRSTEVHGERSELRPEAVAQAVSLSQESHGATQSSTEGPEFHLLCIDYADGNWPQLATAPPLPARYDVILSGFSIHHQPDAIKRRIYADIHDLLAPGGIFLNLEHVASATRWVETQFEAYFIDALHRYHAPRGKTRGQVAADFYHRPDKDANRLAPLELQLQWLRELGFIHVDCFFKVFELALFGGIKASDE
jgi:SAM-dependent methyltransferase